MTQAADPFLNPLPDIFDCDSQLNSRRLKSTQPSPSYINLERYSVDIIDANGKTYCLTIVI